MQENYYFFFCGNLNCKEQFFGILFMIIRLAGNIIAQIIIYLFIVYHMHLCTSP